MGHIIAGSEWRWPGGVIPYTINEEDFPTGDPERAAIAAAVNAWNTSTNITLRPREPGDAGNSYVEFVAGDDSTSCNSPVGRQRGPFGLPKRQEVECNLSTRTLIHEIGHAVGLFHEHQRDDRHWHVTVLAENSIAAKRSNFDKKRDAGDDIGAYDFRSVMHYSSQTFAVDWLNGATIPLQRSTSRPSLAAFDSELHMVHLGVSPSNDLWHAKWTASSGWTDDVRIEGQKSWATPALAVFDDELHMVHLGSSGSDELWHATFRPGGALGGGWSDDTPIEGQRSLTPPALCEFGGMLHLAYAGSPSATMWHSTFNGTWARRDRRDNNRPPLGPALAEFSGSLHAAFVGDNGRMWHSIRDDTLRTIVPPAGVILGGSVLSPGDVAAVAFMYP